MKVRNTNLAEYRRNRTKEQKDAEKKVVTGAGVTGAAVQLNRSKAFAQFASSKKITQGLTTMSSMTKGATAVAKQSSGLWASVKANFSWAKGAVIKWGEQFKNMKYIKPLIESAAFKGVAGIAGFAFGLVTFISGANEIAKTATDVIDETKFSKAA